MSKTFTGFGFGPIQSALFLYEAYRSGNFASYVAVDIDRELVEAVRNNAGSYSINIAREHCIERFTVEGIEIYNPNILNDYSRIVDSVAESDELCTALPSVDIYAAGKNSVTGMIAEGLGKRASPVPTIIYSAENNNRAAEILAERLSEQSRDWPVERLQLLNTVIGKMSGVITDPETIERLSLATITPAIPRAVLVEEFNRILISRVKLSGFRRGIDVFVEKHDLLPFEEAKLFGHNALHALIAYLADLKGLMTMAEAGKDGQIMQIAREAFIRESGAALIKRHAELHDPLFTARGFEEYAEDLLRRMVNPNLNDRVARVGRDHPRKLGIEDRLYGTMALALEYGVRPDNLALGAAAGLISMIRRQGSLKASLASLPQKPEQISADSLTRILRSIWGKNKQAVKYGERLIALTCKALTELQDRGIWIKP